MQQTVTILETLTPEVKVGVLRVLADAHNLQMRVMIAFTAAQIPAVALVWNRKWTHV